MKPILAILLLLIFFSADSQVTRYAGWETGDVFQGMFYPYKICTPYGATISDSFARVGTHSVRIECRADQADCGGNKRSQLFYPKGPMDSTTEWWAVSIYVPVDYAFDSLSESHMNLTNPAGPGSGIGSVWIKADKWFCAGSYDTVNRVIGANIVSYYQEIGPVAKGVWTDWVINAHWAFNGNGFIKYYKDGKLVYNITGTIANRDSNGGIQYPYGSFGTYKWPWHKPGNYNPSVRVLYFDEYRTGGVHSTLSDFVPDKKPVSY